ncbi:hypothetical protein [Conexibacter sp. CPCC 206217]|uniref:hypothetical protein n=1 Tax=Conexibacter sp. CPCC 206217 TaxID=3064574 RepID=UPI00271ADBDE|nr:hypothetical protein [Conexibacter sp. CPCC 206217]MDO8213463.1 hypothetical protein [Conexibacter sp. CPCC 206217]
MPTPEDDGQVQALLLAVLLDRYPAPSTTEELVLEFADDPDDFGQRDEVMRAVRDLAKAGLLHRYPTVHGHRVFVFPTRAAMYYAELPAI